jgi:hypothetical protein
VSNRKESAGHSEPIAESMAHRTEYRVWSIEHRAHGTQHTEYTHLRSADTMHRAQYRAHRAHRASQIDSGKP